MKLIREYIAAFPAAVSLLFAYAALGWAVTANWFAGEEMLKITFKGKDT